MQNYPLRARVLLIIVWLFGLSALLDTYLFPAPDSLWRSLPGVGLACILALVAGARKLPVVRSPRFAEAVNVSMGFLVTFVAMLLYGQRAAVLTGIMSGLAATLFPKRQPIHQMLYNISVIVFCAWASSETYLLITNGAPFALDIHSLGAIFAAALVYFFCNSLPIAFIIGAVSSQSAIRVWREKFAWTISSYLAGACMVALAQLVFHGELLLLLLALPVLFFTYQWYRLYIEQNEQKEKYISELQNKQKIMEDIYQSTVRSLAAAIATKDRTTHSHLVRVQSYAVALAEEMGVSGAELEAVRTGALLHDVGKLGVPDYILTKPGPLNAEEFARMKRHTVIGESILTPVHFPWPVVDVVRSHHERWDGAGYPDGLSGEQIPLCARIMAVADVFDALTSDRPYRTAWSHERALEYIQNGSGRAFDPVAVEALLHIIARECQTGQPIYVPEPPKNSVSGDLLRSVSEEWLLHEAGILLNSARSLEDQFAQLGSRLNTILPDTLVVFALHQSDFSDVIGSAEKRITLIAAPDSAPRLQALREYVNSEEARKHLMKMNGVCRGELSQFGYKSLLNKCLWNDDEFLGTMALLHPSAEAFTADDEILLVTLADMVQQAIMRHKLARKMQEEAFIDPLTGLYNGRYLKDALLKKELAHGEHANECSVLYLDVDNFKLINDTFGHQQGDRVLSALARLLPNALRDQDTVIRLHGDEFLVALPHTGQNEAADIAERIRDVIRNFSLPLQTTEGTAASALNLQISVGIACSPQDGATLEELTNVADQRMYERKRSHTSAIVMKNALEQDNCPEPESSSRGIM